MFLNNLLTGSTAWHHYAEIFMRSLPVLVKGALLYTIPLSIITFIIGLILAVIAALCRISHVPVLRWLARAYISVIRGTPLLVQLFIIFYGLPSVGITMNPWPSAIIGFSLNVGAYAAEIIRAAILSIPKGQWEASYSIGMDYMQAMRRIILPQAARVSVPPLSNTFISLIKDSSLAALVLVTEMFRKAQEIASTNYEFLLVYSEAALIYWIICLILSFAQDRIENKLDRYVAR